ncbi:MAG: right-handed parallel beta-helix repeat-containing protein [Planctomycetes bacterium]|nr:right-handed parallel beta-helix repeat-containing protein [Planctomycetota bacterium]
MKRLALLCLLALACGSVLAGTTRKVPADHATIQEAVDNSVTGDIIAISKNTTTDGVYYENVDVPVGITSLTFTGKVIWDGNVGGNADNCLTINGDPNTNGPYLVQGIIFRNGTRGVFANSGVGNEVDGLTVTGCQGLFLSNQLVNVRGDNFVGTKNTLLGCNSGFSVTGNNTTVSGNKYTQCSGTGVNITAVAGTQKALVDKNTFSLHNGGELINVVSDATSILSNKANNSAGGIVLEGDNSFISGNSLTLTDGGITTSNPSNTLQVLKNKLATTTGDGINVEGNDCLVSGNSITNCFGAALSTDGTSPDVLGNKISIAEGGIVCVNANNAQIIKNSITTVLGGGGIDVTGTNSVVSANSITSCSGLALSTDGASPDVLGNKIKFAGNGGIACSNASNALVDKNSVLTIFANAGIDVTGDTIVVTNNSLADIVVGDGINLSDATTGGATVTSNKMKNVGGDGIDINCDGTSAAVLVSSCSVSFAGAGNQNGIRVRGDNNTIEKCVASNIDGDGFLIDANDCNVTDCSATKCGVDGFDSDNTSDGNAFLRCKASACGGEGFDNSDSTNTTVTDSSFTGNRINLASDNVGAGFIVITNTTPSAVEGAPEVD